MAGFWGGNERYGGAWDNNPAGGGGTGYPRGGMNLPLPGVPQMPGTPMPGPGTPQPRPGSPKPPLNPRPFPPPPRPQPPGVPPTGGPTGGPTGTPPTTGTPGMPTTGTPPTTPTMPNTPTTPMGGGGSATNFPVSGNGFGGGMTSPMTPNINDQSQPNDNFTGGYGTGGGGYGTGGGRSRPPSFGTGPTNYFGGNTTTNIGGNTSFSKDIETHQKKTPERVYSKKTPMGQKEIGDPRLAMQQLSAMNQTPFMRRA